MAARLATKLIWLTLLGWSVVVLPSCHRRERGHVKPQERLQEIAREERLAATQARFVDVAKQLGIDFTARNGIERGERAIIESLGVGVALLDYDRRRQPGLVHSRRRRLSPPRGRSADGLASCTGTACRAASRPLPWPRGIADVPHYAHGAIVPPTMTTMAGPMCL